MQFKPSTAGLHHYFISLNMRTLTVGGIITVQLISSFTRCIWTKKKIFVKWTTASFNFHQMAVHKRTTMLAHCNLKQNMWLCSKQSSFFLLCTALWWQIERRGGPLVCGESWYFPQEWVSSYFYITSAILGLFFFSSFQQLTVKYVQYKNLRMTWFKPRTSGIASDCSANRATTIARVLFLPKLSRKHLFASFNYKSPNLVNFFSTL